MSFTPYIAILWDNLISNETKFENYHWAETEQETRIYKYLHTIITQTKANDNFFTLNGIRFIVCQPETAYFNQTLRDELKNLKIDYSITV